MISTWGIFWICFFGGWLLATLIKNVCRIIRPSAYRIMLTDEQKEKAKEFIKEVAKSIKVNVVNEPKKPGKVKKDKE